MKLVKVDDHLREELKNAHFRRLYNLEVQKLDVVKRIIDYRIKNHLSQKQFASKAGVTQQHISKLEKGIFSNIATLDKVLHLVGLTVQLRVIPLSSRLKKAA